MFLLHSNKTKNTHLSPVDSDKKIEAGRRVLSEAEINVALTEYISGFPSTM